MYSAVKFQNASPPSGSPELESGPNSRSPKLLIDLEPPLKSRRSIGRSFESEGKMAPVLNLRAIRLLSDLSII